MKYCIKSNNYPYATLIADGFSSYTAAFAYAAQLAPSWCYGWHQWHIEEYKA